jgi:hypothetical protein
MMQVVSWISILVAWALLGFFCFLVLAFYFSRFLAVCSESLHPASFWKARDIYLTTNGAFCLLRVYGTGVEDLARQCGRLEFMCLFFDRFQCQHGI